MANLLLDSLRNTKTSPTEATDACKHLLQLQVEGSPCMEHCDPIQLYLTTQVGALIKGCWEPYQAICHAMFCSIATQPIVPHPPGEYVLMDQNSNHATCVVGKQRRRVGS